MLKRVDKVKRGRGRPKLIWDESVKRDLKDCVFWVSSLAYPNSLGTKSYVVDVVVVNRNKFMYSVQSTKICQKGTKITWVW
jgi:hypothetical protein